MKKQCITVVILSLLAGRVQAAEPTSAPDGTDEALTVVAEKLESGKYQEALAAARQAMQAYRPQPTGKITDAKFVRLLDASAAAYLGLKQFVPAKGMALKAYNSGLTSRSITLNLAAAEAQIKIDAMLGAKAAAAYCDANPTDVEAMDLFGAAVDRASRNRTSMKVVQPLIDRYAALLPKLEATKPGFHRWGQTWLNANDYRALQGRRKEAQNDVADDQKAVAKAQKLLKQREAEWKQVDLDNSTRRTRDELALAAAQQNIVIAKRELAAAERELAESLTRIPVPDWPEVLTGFKPDEKLKAK